MARQALNLVRVGARGVGVFVPGDDVAVGVVAVIVDVAGHFMSQDVALRIQRRGADEISAAVRGLVPVVGRQRVQDRLT